MNISAPATKWTSEQLVLSPDVPLATSSSRTLTARLLGDLAGYTQMPVLRCVCGGGLRHVGGRSTPAGGRQGFSWG